jgi:AcrR family transcriptional regulator
MRAAGPTRSVSPALLAATSATLRRLGPRQFSLTAVAEAAGVSRGTVHNALGSRDHAIKTALDYLASVFTETMAAEVDRSRHWPIRSQPPPLWSARTGRARTRWHRAASMKASSCCCCASIGDDLMKRSIELWKAAGARSATRGEVGAGVDPGRARRWIVRMLLSFELLPPIGVNLDSARAVRRFVAEHIVEGLTGASRV